MKRNHSVCVLSKSTVHCILRVDDLSLEIGTPILPRFFLVTSQSGVKSMTLSLDGARERLVGQGHAVIECVQAVWTYKYHNGYTVTLRGPMTAHVLLYLTGPPMQGNVTGQPWTLKFDQLQFDANTHDKLINIDAIAGARVDSPQLSIGPLPNGAGSPEDDHRYDEPRSVIEHASIPVEPVNAFGIPQATMRCLEVCLYCLQGKSMAKDFSSLLRV